MVQKNKNKNHLTSPNFQSVVSILGTTAMLAASVCGVVDHMEHEGQRIMAALQPNYTSASQAVNTHIGDDDNQIRRAGREEIHLTSASYGAVKRSASVSGAV